MAQNLDPNSDGRGVLQFKTGLMSVIKVQPNLILISIYVNTLNYIGQYHVWLLFGICIMDYLFCGIVIYFLFCLLKLVSKALVT